MSIRPLVNADAPPLDAVILLRGEPDYSVILYRGSWALLPPQVKIDYGAYPNMNGRCALRCLAHGAMKHHRSVMSKTEPPKDDEANPAKVITFPKKPAPKADQRRFEARWGRPVADRGYTMLPAVLIRAQHRLGLSPEEFNALLHLVYHWWDPDNNPFPAKATIAARMDKSPQTVRRYLKALEDAGFIRRIERFETHKGQTSNEYDLSGLVAKLEVIAIEEAKVAQENAMRTTNVERRNNRRSAPA